MTDVHPQDASLFSRLSIGEICYLLFRHKWLILSGLVLGIAATGAVYVLTPSFYRSEAKLLVRYIKETAPMDQEGTGDRVISALPRGGNVIGTEVEILTSQALAQQVARSIGVTRIASASMPGPRQAFDDWRLKVRARLAGITVNQLKAADQGKVPLPLRAVTRISEGLQVNVPKKSNVIRLYFRGPSPDLARDVLDSLVNEYLRRHVEIHSAGRSYEFLSQQTDQLRARLAETESQLRELKAEAGIVSIADAKTTAAGEISELRHAVQEAQTALAASRAKIEIIQASMPASARPQLPILAAGVQKNAKLLDAYDRLRRLREREAHLLGSFTEDSIPLKGIREQVEEIQLVIDTEGATLSVTNVVPVAPGITQSREFAPLISELADSAALHARIEILTKRLAEARNWAKRIEDVEDRIVQLERKKEIDEDNYRYFSRSLEQARIDDALDSSKISNISIVQPATLPARMFRPKLHKNMMLAFLLGIAVGVGLTFTREYFIDHSLKKPAELESSLGAPLLISIPSIPSARQLLTGRGQRSSVKLLPAHGQEDGQQHEEGARQKGGKKRETGWSLDNDLRAYYEALRDRLLAQIDRKSDAPHLLGITSCIKGSGVTTTAGGLGVTLARNGDGRVLLIDAAELDFSSAGQLLGSGSSAGLMDILTDEQGNTRIVQPNLYVLSAAEVRDELPPLSLSQGFGQLMEYAKESKYGFVIFDLPPVSETSLALRIAGLLDSVILIIEAEKVQRETAQRAKDLLARANATLIGTVLNKRRTYVPQWLHKEF